MVGWLHAEFHAQNHSHAPANQQYGDNYVVVRVRLNVSYRRPTHAQTNIMGLHAENAAFGAGPQTPKSPRP